MNISGWSEACGTLLSSFVLLLTDGLLCLYSYNYLKRELSAGTPFTEEGAREIQTLGVKYIVMPLVAVIVASVIYACFDIPDRDYLDNAIPLAAGLILLLLGPLFRYGAVLEQKSALK